MPVIVGPRDLGHAYF